MQKLMCRFTIAVIAFGAVNSWLIDRAAAKGAYHYFISATFEKILLFILLQAAMIANICIRPLKPRSHCILLIIISELLVIGTVLFWGFII